LRQTYATQPSISLGHQISDWKASSFGYNVIAVLSGLKTSSPSFSAAIHSVDFDPKKGIVSV